MIEHFELANSYLLSFNDLQASLQDKISNPATLETLATKFHQCFVETLERCIADSQSMPYANRSNKKNEPTRIPGIQHPLPRKASQLHPRPDSGVAIDDGSEESGSMMGSVLGRKESVRTVRGSTGRGSSQLPPTVHEVFSGAMDPGLFDPSLMQQLSSTTPGFGSGSINSAGVQAWNNGVFYPQDDGASTRLSESSLPTANEASQTGFVGWGETFYSGFDGTTTGFQGSNGQSH